MRKRRDEQFLVISLALLFLLNLPLVMIGNHAEAIAGIPIFYLYIGSCWLGAVLIGYLLSRRYHE